MTNQAESAKWQTTMARLSDFISEDDGLLAFSHRVGLRVDDSTTPVNISAICEYFEFPFVSFSLRAFDGIDRECRAFAIACAEKVKHLVKEKSALAALEAAKAHLAGEQCDLESAYAKASAACFHHADFAAMACANDDAVVGLHLAALASVSAQAAAICDATGRDFISTRKAIKLEIASDQRAEFLRFIQQGDA